MLKLIFTEVHCTFSHLLLSESLSGLVLYLLFGVIE